MYENNLYLNDLFELLATPVGIEGAAGDGSVATRRRGAGDGGDRGPALDPATARASSSSTT